MKNAAATVTSPLSSSQRGSHFRPSIHPVSGMNSIVPRPRGALQMPATTAGNPSSVCMNSGSSTRLP